MVDNFNSTITGKAQLAPSLTHDESTDTCGLESNACQLNASHREQSATNIIL